MRFRYKFKEKGAEFPTLKVGLDGPVTFEAYCTPEEFRPGMLLGVVNFAIGTSGNRWSLANGTGLIAVNGPPIEFGKRVHVAAVRTSDGAKLFIDGKLADHVKNVDRPIRNGNFYLGSGFTGLIDELRISKSARYDKDFTPEARFTPDKDTVALYHFDEGIGDVIEDASGNGHHGRTGNATWANADGSPILATPTDFALRFEGDGGVQVATLNVTKEKRITVEAFVKLHRSDDTGFVKLVGHGNLSSSLEDVRFQAQFGGTRTSSGTSSVVAGEDSKRIHVAAVLTETELAIFWDGTKGATTPLTPRNQVDVPAFLIGSFKFQGMLDEIRISKTVRYTKDFAPQRRFEPDADTLALYHCDEGQGDKLIDSSGNGHHGKIIGAKWVHSDGTPKGEAVAGLVAQPLDPAWLKSVAAMTGKQKVEAVKTELMKCNPLFDGQVVTAMTGSEVSAVTITAQNAQGAVRTPPLDVSPIQAFTKLQQFSCNARGLADLSPLRELKLNNVSCSMTNVADLSPLKSMPLSKLECSHSKVSDLSPLKDMPLKYLSFSGTQVTNLSPLKRMPLTHLTYDFKAERDAELLRSIPSLEWINNKPASDVLKATTPSVPPLDPDWLKAVAAMPADKQIEAVKTELMKRNPDFDGALTPTVSRTDVVTELRIQTNNVADLSPLQALTGLKKLNCNSGVRSRSQLVDLSPLKAMPLEGLFCFGTKVSDLSPLRGMPLTYLDIGRTPVVDLAPLKDMKLDSLCFSRTKVADLSPLGGMPLSRLTFPTTPVADLSPLKGMPLTLLVCNSTRVSDLSPLKDMKLITLNVGETTVSDLAPLKGMPLVQLHCNQTSVADLSPLKDMPLKELRCDFDLKRDGAILRALPKLEFINGKLVSEALP
ncbi:MAG: hypothetical protein K2X38_15715 [Gemmataceae bacterium]|nr:hypothetical protein [Gemmataceae bacterium]